MRLIFKYCTSSHCLFRMNKQEVVIGRNCATWLFGGPRPDICTPFASLLLKKRKKLVTPIKYLFFTEKKKKKCF